jgi:serine/threonine protein kinase
VSEFPAASAKTHLGRYELVAKLAAGGMGEIFLARLEGAAGFEKLFVLKRILPHLAGDVRFRTMLADEARITSRLSHPHICQVYELGETEGELYIVMEYLEGATLLPLLRHAARHQRPFELGMVACIIQQICDALHYAHELRDRDGSILQIVHRDVTPSNIFITENGIAKILDFGIAKAKNISSNTQTGTLKGKYAYMAPEQARGSEIDRRVDIFAVGVVLFEMLALRRLFQRRTDYLTLQAVMEHPIPDVRRVRADLPEPLLAALGRALQRNRDDRFDTARQLGAAVVDAIATKHRVWTTSDLSDQLEFRFADEIQRRGAAVLAAVSRPALAVVRSGMPVLAEFAAPKGNEYGDDSDGDHGDSDAELPAMESEVNGAAAYRAQTRTDHAIAVGTAELSATKIEPSLVDVANRRAPESVPAEPRSWLWPLFAIAVLSLAAAVLVVLWRNGQRRPTVLLVSESVSGAATPRSVDGSAPGVVSPDDTAQSDRPGSPDGGADHDAGVATPQGGPPPAAAAKSTPRRDSNALLRAQIGALRPQLVRCLGEHAGSISAALEGAAVVQINARGRVDAVEIKPPAIAATPLGACIRTIFSEQRFAAQRESLEITVPFSAKPRISP